MKVKEIKKLLEDKAYVVNNTYTVEPSYDESISVDKMDSILKNLTDDTYLIDEVDMYLQDVYEPYINDIYENIYSLSGSNDENVRDYIYDSIYVDFNTQGYLNNTRPEDLTIYFGENWDDSYHNIQSWIHDNSEDKVMDWFIESQGYTKEDLMNEEKRNESNFLKELYEECYDYKTDLSGCQLVALPESSNWEAIECLFKRKGNKITLKKGMEFGFFNRIHGTGSGLGIKLEKDLVIPDDIDLRVDVATRNSPYDYSPTTVYGLARRNSKDDIVIEKVGNPDE